MIVKNFVLIFFISFFLFVNCQNNTTEDSSTQAAMDPMEFINTYKGVCVPNPLGIDILSQFQPNCTSLYIPSQNDTQFHCCEIEFQEKKNKSAPVRHGCMAVLKNYVDNDRYEDMIDYIKRGKQDKIEEYSIFLGRTYAQYFQGFLKNKTKYDVYKFDCFSAYQATNLILIFVEAILLFGII